MHACLMCTFYGPKTVASVIFMLPIVGVPNIVANKKSRFQPLVKMGMKTVDKNIDKKISNDLGGLMQLSRL
jgi:hypothetical protein